jgi:toxin-antitoxin system PIN domain toxin
VSSTYLLDANALIALVVADHEHHDSALAWASTVDRVAVCPIVEGALLRFLIRVGESQATASTILSALHSSPRCEFWEDAISYTAVNLEHVVGHRQVSDSYLAALAVSRGCKLATFDQALANALPDYSQLIS